MEGDEGFGRGNKQFVLFVEEISLYPPELSRERRRSVRQCVSILLPSCDIKKQGVEWKLSRVRPSRLFFHRGRINGEVGWEKLCSDTLQLKKKLLPDMG